MAAEDRLSANPQPPEQSATRNSDLSISAAHEINNPLDSILNLLHLLSSEVTSETGHHYLILIEQELGRVAQIARRALAPYKASTGPEDTDVSALVESVVDVYRSSLELKGIKVSTRAAGAHISAYPGDLRQMISNLLLNAMDALPKGGELQVRTSATHEWNGEHRRGVRLTVGDNGSGINGDHLPRIFERFFTTKGSGGSGMGLALVKDIMQKHHGTLRVRSTTRSNRSGTVFSMFLPESHLSQLSSSTA